jgi:hypothetical protein
MGILLGDIIRAAAAAGGGAILHVESAHPVETLRDFFNSGAYLLFGTLPSDRRSSFGALEQQARKRPLDRRAFYLYRDFLP